MSNQLMSNSILQTSENQINQPFTDTETDLINTYCQAINLSDSTAIIDYGSDTQKKLSELSGRMLSNLGSQNMDDIGKVLDRAVTYLSLEEEPKKKSLFSRKVPKQSLREKYQEAEKNVDRVAITLQEHQIRLMKDCAMLNQLYEMNTLYFRELNLMIAAGKQKLTQCRQSELPAMEKRARETGLPQDSQALADLKNQMDRFEKKLHELELTASISLQSAPLIRMIQTNQTAMATKLQSTLLNTIPLWKNQVIFALGSEHNKQISLADHKANQAMNKLIKQNTNSIRLASVETVESARRNFNDVANLEESNKQLIEGLKEVSNIKENQDSAIPLAE